MRWDPGELLVAIWLAGGKKRPSRRQFQGHLPRQQSAAFSETPAIVSLKQHENQRLFFLYQE
jgi:hypothetical protein